MNSAPRSNSFAACAIVGQAASQSEHAKSKYISTCTVGFTIEWKTSQSEKWHCPSIGMEELVNRQLQECITLDMVTVVA